MTRTQNRRLALLLVLAMAVLMIASQAAEAQSTFNFGQFMAGRLAEHEDGYVFVHNPTNVEMYAMAIVYDSLGVLIPTFGTDGCAGAVLPPHGNPDQEFQDFDTNDSPDGPYHYEVLAVPASSEGGSAGAISSNFGVTTLKRQAEPGRAIDHRVFDVPDDDTLACICCEVDLDGEDLDIFDAFGVDCSDLEGSISCS